jgi:uncharacterized protein (TIGR02597 family)
MKKISLQLLYLSFVAMLLGTLAVAKAQTTTVTTDPVGFMTLAFAGNGGGTNPALTFSGLGLANAVAYQGMVSAIGTNTLTCSGAGWTNNQFNGGNGSFYVEIISGTNPGITTDITATTASNQTISTTDDLSALVSAGSDRFRIRPHWTIGTVFGATNQAGLGGGTSTSADQILLWNGSGYDTYYYQTSGFGGTGWRKAGSPSVNAAGTRMEPDQGLIIVRKKSSAVALMLQGSVKTGQSSIPVNQGVNIIGNIYAANMTLTSSSLYTGSSSTGLSGGTSTSADQVLLWNGSGYDTYYYQTSGFGGTGWRRGGAPTNDASSTIIPMGSSIVVQRQNAPAFDWVAPQHPSSLN